MGEQIGIKATWWRAFNVEVIRDMQAAWGLQKIHDSNGPEAPPNGHHHFMRACIAETREAGNSGYVRAVKPYWDARDIAFYFWGVSPAAASAEGYKAMQAHYSMDAPAWAWW